jgi:predicted RNase H-like HicB family nuclease
MSTTGTRWAGKYGVGAREVPMKMPFITILRSEDRILMRSPILPELFAEGRGLEQSIERLGNALQVLLEEYEKRDRTIALPPAGGIAASVSPDDVPFVEVRSESNGRYLMTSPIFPQLFAEGKGINQSITRLITALKVVLDQYARNDLEIPAF